MVSKETFDKLRIEFSIKSKNGLDFTMSASIVWLLIAAIWTLEIKPYDQSVLTFVIGGFVRDLIINRKSKAACLFLLKAL